MQTSCGETVAVAPFCHTAYDDVTYKYDICMLRLARESVCSPIGIGDAGVEGVVLGFGGQDDFSVQEMQALVLTDCVWPEVDSATQLCAKSETGADTCFGDSGGPIFYDNSLWGIVSYGADACDASHPTVFTRTSAFDGWVSAYMLADQQAACACTCISAHCAATPLCDAASYPDWQIKCNPTPVYATVLAVAGCIVFCIAILYVQYPRMGLWRTRVDPSARYAG